MEQWPVPHEGWAVCEAQAERKHSDAESDDGLGIEFAGRASIASLGDFREEAAYDECEVSYFLGYDHHVELYSPLTY